MIDQSCYWKDDLLRQAAALRGRKQQRRWPEASFASFEQTIMLGFYSIRKLIEATKLSDSMVNQVISLTIYPWSGTTVTRMNCHKLDQLYDFNSPANESRAILFLCHQIVHSFVFMPAFDKDGSLNGILVTSDRHRHQRLYFMALDCIIELFDCVGNDYPSAMRMVYNPVTQDYDVRATIHTDGNCAR